MQNIIAVDIGGTKVRIAAFAADSGWNDGPLAEHDFATPRSGDVAADLAAMMREVSGDAAGIAAVGAGCPGPLDPRRGVVLNPPNLSEGWWNLDVPQNLGKHLELPPEAIHLDNDCNLAALGESEFGAGRGYPSILYVTVSTGVGGGLVVDGEVFGGARGFAAEVGHMKLTDEPFWCGCGRTGCVESATSGEAIARRARESGWRPPSGGVPASRDVFEAADAGDAVAREIVERAAGYLAEALVNFIYAYDPAVIVLGGGVTDQPLFMRLTLEAFERVPMMPAFRGVPVVKAALGGRSVVAGAFVRASGSTA